MATIQAGILSNVRGAVAGVVGGVWKGTNYVRARVTPANPQTEAQTEQRNKMAAAVAFGKLILGGILQPFVDPFQKTMSGFNWFIKHNIAYFGESIDYSSMQVTDGVLYAGQLGSALTEVNNISVDWNTGLGSNGLATDLVTAIAFYPTTGAVYQVATPVLRSAGSLDIPVTGMTEGGTAHVWVVFYRLDGSKVTMVSNSTYILGAN